MPVRIIIEGPAGREIIVTDVEAPNVWAAVTAAREKYAGRNIREVIAVGRMI